MHRYRLSAAAQPDVVDILGWTQEQFGEAARPRNQELLVAALRDIAMQPDRPGSIDRPELGARVRPWLLRSSRPAPIYLTNDHNVDSLCTSRYGDPAVTMHINLSSEMEAFIKGKVASGFYGNATEVIRDAIRRMQAEEDRLQAWRAAIDKGDDELERGEGIVYTDKALDDITETAIGNMHSGKPMDPDVLP